MKTIKRITIILFSLMLLLPLLRFNLVEDSISMIDNRKLAPNPFQQEIESKNDLPRLIENYVNDRIGFRDKMIRWYTVLNDRLFHTMDHPSYVYGKNGYVFGAGLTVKDDFCEYHHAFADMVKQIQDYCEARGVPFLFVFNPAKPAIYPEFIEAGTNYNRDWVGKFLQELDVRGVRYIDNTAILTEKKQEGEVVYNQKYDANHWNDLGAYYGVNAILQTLQEDFPQLHVNQPEELNISYETKYSLPVSEFPINEDVPVITFENTIAERTSSYLDELEMDSNYHTFSYRINAEKLRKGAPKALVFQGSYMNEYGHKYLANSLGTYISVHDYQNIINFPYFFNIFKPECVVFEVAEYTLSNSYFNFERMSAMKLNPTYQDAQQQASSMDELPLREDSLTIEEGATLTKINWSTSEQVDCAWLLLDTEYDMMQTEQGYTVTIPTKIYRRYQHDLTISTLTAEHLVTYQL